MPLIQSSQDHLAHIDPPPSPTSLSAAKSLIASELSDFTLPHPSLRPLPSPTFTPTITSSLTLLSSAQPLPQLDFIRYEAPTAPSSTSASAHDWTAALRSACISTGYLAARAENLALLETFGRNAWLVGNAQLEDVLRDLEVEVKQAREEVEKVQAERERGQGSVKAEMEELERTWRGQVGRLLEVQVAGEKVREEIERRRREGEVVH